jgi:hypothetical protein
MDCSIRERVSSPLPPAALACACNSCKCPTARSSHGMTSCGFVASIAVARDSTGLRALYLNHWRTTLVFISGCPLAGNIAATSHPTRVKARARRDAHGHQVVLVSNTVGTPRAATTGWESRTLRYMPPVRASALSLQPSSLVRYRPKFLVMKYIDDSDKMKRLV